MKRNISFVKSKNEELLPSSSSSAANNANTQATEPLVFHRKIYSADGLGSSAPPSTLDFTPRTFRFPSNSPPNYYQLALQQEEEDRRRQELFSFIYSTSPVAPPSHPPPEVPPKTSESCLESAWSDQRLNLKNSVLNNNLRPPSFRHLRAVSTDATFSTFRRHTFDEDNTHPGEDDGLGDLDEIVVEHSLELAALQEQFDSTSLDYRDFSDNEVETMRDKPSLEMVEDKRKLSLLKEIAKSTEFSASVDENFAPAEFKSSSVSSSPRSLSEPPPHQPKTPELHPREKSPSSIDEESNHHYVNSHELSLFFCSPSVSQLDSTIDLMNTSEFPPSEESEQTIELDSAKPGNVFTFDEAEIEQHRRKSIEDIQARPLPALPEESRTPEEPEDNAPDDEIPEPEYAYVDGDLPGSLVFHQRSISDHVLSYRQKMEDEASSIELKKSNSDRSERRSSRRKTHEPLASTSSERKPSDTGPDHQRTISCSALLASHPDQDDLPDGRKRCTTDSLEEKSFQPSGASKTMTAIRIRPRMDNNAPNSFASVRCRDGTKSMLTLDPKHRPQPNSNPRQIKASPVIEDDLNVESSSATATAKKHSLTPTTITSLVDKFTSRRQNSLPQMQSLSFNGGKTKDESPLRRSFKWKNFFGSKQHTVTSPPEPTSTTSNLARSASAATVKLRVKNDSKSPPTLSTLDENDDRFEAISNISTGNKAFRRSVIERPWRSFFGKATTAQENDKLEEEAEEEPLKVLISPPTKVHRRRISVIGDVESDRKMFAPNPVDCAKLEKFIESRRESTDPKSPSSNKGFTSSSSEDEPDNHYQSDNRVATTPKRRRTIHRMKTCRTLSRASGHESNAPSVTEYSSRTLTPRKPRGIHKRWKRDAVHRRRSVTHVLNEGVAVVLGEMISNENEPSTQLGSKEMTDEKPKKKLANRRFLNNAAVGDINKGQMKYEKDKKNSGALFGGILSLRSRGKKSKENPRSLANIYPNYNGSNQQASGYSPTATTNNNRHDFRAPLPDVLANALGSSTTRLSDSGSSGSRTPFLNGHNHFFEDFPPPLQLNKPKWGDLSLWDDEPEAWSSKHRESSVSTSERKRQNIIYELYLTEKNHCRVIVFLQQAYQVGIKSLKLLSDEQIASLIPDVLDSLLDFHLRLLRRIRERRNESIVVPTVSDIVAQEFENGLFTNAAINAYTNFCMARDEACQVYHDLVEKYPKVKKFFDHYELDPMYKQHSFKSCLLLITQRISKYNLLFDQILKYDTMAQKPQTQKALTAVREFARRIDSELRKNDIQKKWDQLRSTLDKRSRGKILNRDFTYDDLVHHRMDDPRQVLAIGKVHYSSPQQAKSEKLELTMVLFDDIVVLFQLSKNNTLMFCNQNMMSSVIPLKTMLIREMERTNECMLVCTDKEKPDMYHLSFATKTELRNWVTQLHSAKATAPNYVRYAPGRKTEVTLQKNDEFNEEPHNKKVQEWQDELAAMIDERKNKEDLLRDYMIGRMRFFDELRAHFKKFPIRHINLSTSTLAATGALLERRETRDLDKIRNLVNQKFDELRQHRRAGLDSLVETAEKAREYDLKSFFDDLHDLALASSSSSDSAGSRHIEETSTSSNSDDDLTPTTSKEKKPRRVRTYHGQMDSQPRGSIRRHTTVPKLGESGGIVCPDDTDEAEDQIDELLRKLPLSMPTRARKAATSLIHENVNLRIENNKLKSEIAMQELHISSLKSRKTAVVETTEKLESLRQKQEDIQMRERKLKQEQDNFKEELMRRRDELDAIEEKLKMREAELETRTQYTQATLRSGACVFQENPTEHTPPPLTPSIPTTSPNIINKLASKTVVTTKRK